MIRSSSILLHFTQLTQFFNHTGLRISSLVTVIRKGKPGPPHKATIYVVVTTCQKSKLGNIGREYLEKGLLKKNHNCGRSKPFDISTPMESHGNEKNKNNQS